MHNVRSTFPLDENALTRTALGRVLTDPITWVPFVPVVAAYTIFDVPAVIALAGGGAVLAGVGAFWRWQWAGITDGLRRAMIDDHNRAQNTALQADANEMRGSGAPAYAQQLERFLEIKKQVERRLHEDGAMTPQKIQLEQLIDSLCFGVRDQLTNLAHREKARELVDRRAVLAQVDTAFATLQSTVAELDVILGPAEIAGGAAGASLEEVTRRLREEAEIAHRVQARLRAQENPEFSPATKPLESE